MRAPFPWFGGKSGAASMVWERLGDVVNYVEPFFGSGAVLLSRPAPFDGPETVNDLDGMVSNFWRALQVEPDAVAEHADWPVTECDLHARHGWLVGQRESLVERLMGDPGFYDAKVAGWWVWGVCCWIGTGFCSGDGPWVQRDGQLVLGDPGRGINRKLPHLGPGRGINRQLPHLGNPGRGPRAVLPAVAERMRWVRVACGDWTRVLGPSVTYRQGLTGVFLDPPYARGDQQYAAGGTGTDLAREVAGWCREHGTRSDLRIALCGHDGDYDLPGWESVGWTSRGGYGKLDLDDEDDNRHRERVWFSPSCLRARQGVLPMDVAPGSGEE